MTKVQTILGTMTFGEQVDEVGARTMIDAYTRAGGNHLDSAYLYCDGKTEAMLGRLIPPEQRRDLFLATKTHPTESAGLSADVVTGQLEASLARLNTDHVDLFYLHSPALDTPITETLEACFNLYRQGKFRHFGLSNYAAWQVAEIVELCKSEGWMKPTVYQGMYNAFTRDVERELFPCLRNYSMSFNAYNPLAGGLLSGKHVRYEQGPAAGRFKLHQNYLDRFWNETYFEAVSDLARICDTHDLVPADAALRWLAHHSYLSVETDDGIILGVSKAEHLASNMDALNGGALPAEVVDVFQRGWEITRPDCCKYFRP